MIPATLARRYARALLQLADTPMQREVFGRDLATFVRNAAVPAAGDASLLSVLDFTPLLDPVLRPVEVAPGRWCYDTPHTPFRLWRFEVDGDDEHTATGRELLLCTDGDLGALVCGRAVYLAPGEQLRLTGRGTVFRVEEVDAA